MFDLEIRKRLGRYCNKRMKVADLADWLNTESWNVHDAPEGTQRLLFDAMRLVSEYDNGDWTEPELRQKLGALSRIYWFDQAPKTAWTLSGSASDTAIIPHPLRLMAGCGCETREHAGLTSRAATRRLG